MVSTRHIKITTLVIAGTAAITVERILYRPFHDRMSRSIRVTRSMRSRRRIMTLVSPSVRIASTTSSTMDIMTMSPSN